jgi:hypothetical protein
MDTVLRVDLEPWVGTIVIAQDFIDARRAVALCGLCEFRQVYIDWDASVRQL